MPELYEIKDNKLVYNPHPGQIKAWNSKSRFTFIIAGTQSGKTSFTPLWLEREIRLAGHGDFLAATSTFDLYKLKFLPEMRKFFVDIFHWKEDKSDRVFWKSYKPRMFDRIILRSAASEAGLESATVRAAVLDECGQDEFRITAWEAVLRRLSLSQGRVLGATTPYNIGWLKQEIFDKSKDKSNSITVIQFPSITNPLFPMEEYNRARKNLPDWKFQMFYNGIFTHPAGLIYDTFNSEYREAGGHKVHPFEIPSNWIRRVGLDFGAVHTATLWLAENPETGENYVYRETLEGGQTTRQHVEMAKNNSLNENVISWTGGAANEDQYRMDWNDAGVYVSEPMIKEVEAGIDRVIELWKTKHLFVFDTCKMLIDELGTYSRKVDEFGNTTEDIKDKNDFHMLDALRYAVVGIQTSWVMAGRY
jgi:hypothetical protein